MEASVNALRLWAVLQLGGLILFIGFLLIVGLQFVRRP